MLGIIIAFSKVISSDIEEKLQNMQVCVCTVCTHLQGQAVFNGIAIRHQAIPVAATQTDQA